MQQIYVPLTPKQLHTIWVYLNAHRTENGDIEPVIKIIDEYTPHTKLPDEWAFKSQFTEDPYQSVYEYIGQSTDEHIYVVQAKKAHDELVWRIWDLGEWENDGDWGLAFTNYDLIKKWFDTLEANRQPLYE